MVARPIDLDTWSRREQFAFFRTYLNPYFSITATVDVTRLLEVTRSENGPRFSIASTYMATQVANGIEAFRCRIRGAGAVVHEIVHCNSTIALPDHTFAFAQYEYSESFSLFCERADAVDRRISQHREKLASDPLDDDVLYFSSIPWISFTGFNNAHRLENPDSVPRIVFGKYYDDRGRWLLPVCVDVHHALVDGYHIGLFFDAYQGLLNAAAETLAT